MDGACLTCGIHTTDLEAHHVAGRRNHRTLTVPVCLDCHAILSWWQMAHGIELQDSTPGTELDEVRALLVGVLDLLRLLGQRHPERMPISATLATHTARAVSRILDQSAPEDRPGRWTPDPTMYPREATPVGWPQATETERAQEAAATLRDLAAALDDPSTLFTVLAEQATYICEAFDQATPALTSLLMELCDHVARCHGLVVQLLTDMAAGSLNEALMDDLAVWYLTVSPLIDAVFHTALGGLPGDDSDA